MTQDKKGKKPEKVIPIPNSHNVLEFYPVVYPKNNPDTAIDDITNALEYVGTFRNIKRPTQT